MCSRLQRLLRFSGLPELNPFLISSIEGQGSISLGQSVNAGLHCLLHSFQMWFAKELRSLMYSTQLAFDTWRQFFRRKHCQVVCARHLDVEITHQ